MHAFNIFGLLKVTQQDSQKFEVIDKMLGAGVCMHDCAKRREQGEVANASSGNEDGNLHLFTTITTAISNKPTLDPPLHAYMCILSCST